MPRMGARHELRLATRIHRCTFQPLFTVNQTLNLSITPQKLRQNFTSYAASVGVPASVAAMWQGHGVEVAERHYRAQLIDRQAGHSFESAMGLLGQFELSENARAPA